MNRQCLVWSVLYGLATMFVACNQPFEPRSPLESKLVVFSVLSTDRVEQYVRVEQTYMPTGYDAMAYSIDGFVRNALVTIQGPNGTYTLCDTTIARLDTSRYKMPLGAYYARLLAINYGDSYTVEVKSSGFADVSASVVIPKRPALSMIPLSIAILQSPGSFQDDDEIAFTVDLGTGSKGWIGRFFICYAVFQNGRWIEDRTPVPISYIFPKVFTTIVYGELTRAGYKNHSAAVYRNDFYRKTLLHIIVDKYPNARIKFRRALFELVQVEESLYNYYLITHANNDRYSVRLDEPMYTNLADGVGVVGAYTLDSLVQAYPDNFTYNRE